MSDPIETGVEILPFSSEYEVAFRELNLAWIRKHWEPEPADFEVLDHPQRNIIDKGGYIAFAVKNGSAVGTCALLKIDDESYELAKMAVQDSARGEGVGWQIGSAIVAKALELGASRIYLESNTVLEPALNLYRKLGFEPVAGQPSPYERCNVQMELLLHGS